ncbi:MAG: fatty acid CoA ligase family protein [Acidobacteriota bacterium]
MNGSVNLVRHLPVLAGRWPLRPALIYPGGSLTFAELDEQTDCCARGLQQIGVRRGDRTVLMVRPGPEFLVLTFALLKLGAVLVLVDPGMGRQNLGPCLRESEPFAFLGVPIAHLARIALGWARPTVKLLVTVGGLRLWGGYSFQGVMAQGVSAQTVDFPSLREEDPAAIVFTSGSTGTPKGVVYTHGMLVAQAELLRQSFGIRPGEVDLATFPLFALFDPALGMTTVFPQMDFTRPGQVDPTEIIQAIERHDVTHMFGSPALLERVGRYGEEHGVRLETLRRVLCAGAPVRDQVLKRFTGMLTPEAEIHTPYGATEALPICSISSRELLKENGSAQGKGVCVGRPLENVHLAVVQVTDGPIENWSKELLVPEGEIGELVVWGSNVSSQYFGRPGANRLAKIPSSDGRIRHRMGDLGYLDARGRIWFCGRKAHRVIRPRRQLFTVVCEGIYNQHREVLRSALVGVGKAPNQRPVLCVELEDKANWRGSSALAEEILSLGRGHAQTKEIETLLFHPSFPVDIRHNAKIFRHKLALWAATRI